MANGYRDTSSDDEEDTDEEIDTVEEEEPSLTAEGPPEF